MPATTKQRDLDELFGCTYEQAMATPWPPVTPVYRRNRLPGHCVRCAVDLPPRAGWLGSIAGGWRFLCSDHKEVAEHG